MSRRVTFERILRDDDDDAGQTIRDWKIEASDGHVTIKDRHDAGFIMLRPEDVDVFMKDLHDAQVCAREKAE